MLKYTEQQEVALAMIKYGGGFVSHLGDALQQADRDNTRRIKEAFPEYWEQYLKLYIDNYTKEEVE